MTRGRRSEKLENFADVLYEFRSVVLFSVQFRGKAARSEGKFDEAATGGDHDQDGGARQGFHEGQAEGDDFQVLAVFTVWFLSPSGGCHFHHTLRVNLQKSTSI